MKKLFLSLVLLFVFGMNAKAQNYVVVDNSAITKEIDAIEKKLNFDNFERFNIEQKIKVRKKSAEFLNLELRRVALSSGIIFNNNYFWKIRLREKGKTKFLFFKANKSLTEISKKECRLEPLLELVKNKYF